MVRRFRGGIVWVTIGQDCTAGELASRVNDVVERLDGERPGLSDPEQAGLRLGQVLDEREATLLVVDDVWTAEQLQPFLVGGSHCARLVTTRMVGALPSDAEQVYVDAMNDTEAQQLLAWKLAVPTGSFDELVSLAGGWPLLLTLINSAARRAVARGAHAHDAIHRISERLHAEGPATFDQVTENQRGRAIGATIEASLALLEGWQRDCYRALAIFPEDAEIPHDALVLLWAATHRLDGPAVDRLCEEFAQMSLVMHYRQDRRSLQLHDVVVAYLRNAAGLRRLAAMHRRFLDRAATLVPAEPPDDRRQWWLLPTEASYLWRRLVYHLAQADRRSELDVLVTDPRWIVKELHLLGPAQVESDLGLVAGPVTSALQRRIGQAAHLLKVSDPGPSLGAILRSRIRDTRELQPLLDSWPAISDGRALTATWPLPDLPSEGLRRVLPGHHAPLEGCSIDADGRWLAALGRDGTVWIRETEQWTIVDALPGHNGPVTGSAFAPNGQWLATTSVDGTTVIWQSGTWTITATLRAHAGPVTGCAASPDGQWLITTGADTTAVIWRVDTWTPHATLRGHTSKITACAVTANGEWLATASHDRTCRLWDLPSGQPRSTLRGHAGAVTGCHVSRDGAWLATISNDRTFRICDPATGRTVVQFKGHPSRLTACGFAPDRSWLATTSDDGTLRIWKPPTTPQWSIMRGHIGRVTGCAVAPDGSWIATSGEDGTIRVWDPNEAGTGSRLHTSPAALRACAVLPSRGWIITSDSTRTATIRDATARATVMTLSGHTGDITACAAAASGRWVVTTSTDRTSRIFAAAAAAADADERGTDLRTKDDRNTGDRPRNTLAPGSRRNPPSPNGENDEAVVLKHPSEVTACAIAPDESWLVTGSADRIARIWRPEGGAPLIVLDGHTGSILDCAVAPAGSWLVTASTDGTARTWHTASGELINTLRGHQGPVTGCAVAHDGTWLATVGHDGTIRIWNPEGGPPQALLTGHDGPILGCDSARDGPWLATVGTDRTIRIWSPPSSTCQTLMRVDGQLARCAWGNNGLLAVTGARGLYVFTLT